MVLITSLQDGTIIPISQLKTLRLGKLRINHSEWQSQSLNPGLSDPKVHPLHLWLHTLPQDQLVSGLPGAPPGAQSTNRVQNCPWRLQEGEKPGGSQDHGAGPAERTRSGWRTPVLKGQPQGVKGNASPQMLPADLRARRRQSDPHKLRGWGGWLMDREVPGSRNQGRLHQKIS